MPVDAWRACRRWAPSERPGPGRLPVELPGLLDLVGVGPVAVPDLAAVAEAAAELEGRRRHGLFEAFVMKPVAAECAIALEASRTRRLSCWTSTRSFRSRAWSASPPATRRCGSRTTAAHGVDAQALGLLRRLPHTHVFQLAGPTEATLSFSSRRANSMSPHLRQVGPEVTALTLTLTTKGRPR